MTSSYRNAVKAMLAEGVDPEPMTKAEILDRLGNTIETPVANSASNASMRMTKAEILDLLNRAATETHDIARRFEAYRKVANAEDAAHRRTVDVLGEVRNELTEARTQLMDANVKLDEKQRELIAMTDSRDNARLDWRAVDKALERANVRHRKDKKRIKALVNALAGLR